MRSDNARLRLLIIVPALALMASVTFESSRRLTVAEYVQVSIDSAADAAAAQLGDADAVVAAARTSAREARTSGLVVELSPTDVELGHLVDGVFRPSVGDFDRATAVRITKTHSYATVLAPLWGVREWSVTQSTIRHRNALHASR